MDAGICSSPKSFKPIESLWINDFFCSREFCLVASRVQAAWPPQGEGGCTRPMFAGFDAPKRVRR